MGLCLMVARHLARSTMAQATKGLQHMIDPASELSHLCGQIVLIAEPNPLIAMDLAATFSGWGAVPVLYYDLDGAAQLAAPGLASAALVDLPPDHGLLDGLIGELAHHGVPTALTSADGAHSFGGNSAGLKVFDKPVDYAALAQWFSTAGAPSEYARKTCTG